MASFNLAHALTQKNEGGYASKELAASIGDRGGETYRGMARNMTGSNKVWSYIDAYKYYHGTPKNYSIIPDSYINSLVDQFYKTDIWDKIKGDNINSQSVANVLFDIATNSGNGTAAKTVQRVLKLDDDGVIGTITLNKINQSNPNTLINDIITYRKWWLNEYQQGKSYLNALLERVDKYKNFITENSTSIIPFAIAALLIGYAYKKNSLK